MNDVSTVPARIVVIGTSKKKLAERFKDLSPERRVSRRSSPGASSRVSRSSRPPPEPKLNQNFLHDDYMDNDLFEKRRRAKLASHSDHGGLFDRHRLQQKRPIRDEFLSDVSEEDFDEEVVNLPAYGPRRQRQIMNLYNGDNNGEQYHNGNGVERIRSSIGNYAYNNESPMRPRFPRRQFVYVNRRRFRPTKFIPLPKRLPVSIPLEERISILRKHNQMPFQFRGHRTGMPFSRMRPNLKRLQHFVPRDRERFGGRGRFLDRIENRGGYGGGRNKFSDNNNPRTKMSLTELDQELDEYMKSSKHPRIEVGAGAVVETAASKHPRVV